MTAGTRLQCIAACALLGSGVLAEDATDDLEQEKMKAVEMLLKAGVEVNKQSIIGESALYCAANQGKYDVAIVLLAAGADKDLKTQGGKTALDTARWMGKNFKDEEGYQYQRVVKLLSDNARGVAK